jgi:hypothetical protein
MEMKTNFEKFDGGLFVVKENLSGCDDRKINPSSPRNIEKCQKTGQIR